MIPLTIEDIKQKLLNMRVGEKGIKPARWFSFTVKGSKRCSGKTPLRINDAFFAIAVTQYDDNRCKCRHYCCPAVIDKIQKIIEKYGEVYDIF